MKNTLRIVLFKVEDSFGPNFVVSTKLDLEISNIRFSWNIDLGISILISYAKIELQKVN